MLIAGATTMLAIAAVLGIIGYRLLTLQESVPQPRAEVAQTKAMLPKGARILATTVGGDRIVVMAEGPEGVELLLFDLRTLAPAGRLRLVPEP